MEKEGVGLVDFFSPAFVIAFILAAISDFCFIFLIGVFIPVIGQIVALGVLGLHLFAGIFILALIFPNLKHFLPKLILGAAVFLPLPFLLIGIILSVLAQNRLVELVLTQAALAVVTGGAGNAASVVAEGAGAGAEAAEGLNVAARGLEVGASAASREVAEEGMGAAEKGLRGRAEKKLRRRAQELEGEVGEEGGEKEERNRRAEEQEEIYGIEEPTEKMKELFEPEYNSNQKEEVEDEVFARQRFEARRDLETKERRLGLGQKQETIETVFPLMEEGAVDDVEVNEEGNEVNLKKAA